MASTVVSYDVLVQPNFVQQDVSTIQRAISLRLQQLNIPDAQVKQIVGADFVINRGQLKKEAEKARRELLEVSRIFDDLSNDVSKLDGGQATQDRRLQELGEIFGLSKPNLKRLRSKLGADFQSFASAASGVYRDTFDLVNAQVSKELESPSAKKLLRKIATPGFDFSTLDKEQNRQLRAIKAAYTTFSQQVGKIQSRALTLQKSGGITGEGIEKLTLLPELRNIQQGFDDVIKGINKGYADVAAASKKAQRLVDKAADEEERKKLSLRDSIFAAQEVATRALTGDVTPESEATRRVLEGTIRKLEDERVRLEDFGKAGTKAYRDISRESRIFAKRLDEIKRARGELTKEEVIARARERRAAANRKTEARARLRSIQQIKLAQVSLIESSDTTSISRQNEGQRAANIKQLQNTRALLEKERQQLIANGDTESRRYRRVVGLTDEYTRALNRIAGYLEQQKIDAADLRRIEADFERERKQADTRKTAAEKRQQTRNEAALKERLDFERKIRQGRQQTEQQLSKGGVTRLAKRDLDDLRRDAESARKEVRKQLATLTDDGQRETPLFKRLTAEAQRFGQVVDRVDTERTRRTQEATDARRKQTNAEADAARQVREDAAEQKKLGDQLHKRQQEQGKREIDLQAKIRAARRITYEGLTDPSKSFISDEGLKDSIRTVRTALKGLKTERDRLLDIGDDASIKRARAYGTEIDDLNQKISGLGRLLNKNADERKEAAKVAREAEADAKADRQGRLDAIAAEQAMHRKGESDRVKQFQAERARARERLANIARIRERREQAERFVDADRDTIDEADLDRARKFLREQRNALSQYGDRIRETHGESSRLWRDNQVQVKRYHDALDRLKTPLRDFNRGLENSGDLFKRFLTYALGYGGLYQVLFLFVELGRSVVELNQQMKSIQAIADLSRTQLTSIGAAIANVALQTRFTTTEIAEAAQKLAQAGVDPEDISKVLRNTALFATATGSTIEVASDLLTTSRNVFKDLGEEVIADQLTRAINISKLTGDDLKVILGVSAQVAKSFELTSEQYLAAVTTLRNAGLRASTVGTGLRQGLLELFTPKPRQLKILRTRYLAIGDELGKASDEAIQQRFFEFTQTSNPLVSVLRELERLGFSGSGRQDFANAFNVRAQNAIKALIADLDQLEQSESRITFGSAAADAAATQMEGLQASVQNLFAALTTLTAQVSGPLVEGLAKGAQGLTNWIERVTILDNKLKSLGDSAGVAGSVIGATGGGLLGALAGRGLLGRGLGAAGGAAIGGGGTAALGGYGGLDAVFAVLGGASLLGGARRLAGGTFAKGATDAASKTKVLTRFADYFGKFVTALATPITRSGILTALGGVARFLGPWGLLLSSIPIIFSIGKKISDMLSGTTPAERLREQADAAAANFQKSVSDLREYNEALDAFRVGPDRGAPGTFARQIQDLNTRRDNLLRSLDEVRVLAEETTGGVVQTSADGYRDILEEAGRDPALHDAGSPRYQRFADDFAQSLGYVNAEAAEAIYRAQGRTYDVILADLINGANRNRLQIEGVADSLRNEVSQLSEVPFEDLSNQQQVLLRSFQGLDREHRRVLTGYAEVLPDDYFRIFQLWQDELQNARSTDSLDQRLAALRTRSESLRTRGEAIQETIAEGSLEAAETLYNVMIAELGETDAELEYALDSSRDLVAEGLREADAEINKIQRALPRLIAVHGEKSVAARLKAAEDQRDAWLEFNRLLTETTESVVREEEARLQRLQTRTRDDIESLRKLNETEPDKVASLIASLPVAVRDVITRLVTGPLEEVLAEFGANAGGGGPNTDQQDALDEANRRLAADNRRRDQNRVRENREALEAQLLSAQAEFEEAQRVRSPQAIALRKKIDGIENDIHAQKEDEKNIGDTQQKLLEDNLRTQRQNSEFEQFKLEYNRGLASQYRDSLARQKRLADIQQELADATERQVPTSQFADLQREKQALEVVAIEGQIRAAQAAGGQQEQINSLLARRYSLELEVNKAIEDYRDQQQRALLTRSRQILADTRARREEQISAEAGLGNVEEVRRLEAESFRLQEQEFKYREELIRLTVKNVDERKLQLDQLAEERDRVRDFSQILDAIEARLENDLRATEQAAFGSAEEQARNDVRGIDASAEQRIKYFQGEAANYSRAIDEKLQVVARLNAEAATKTGEEQAQLQGQIQVLEQRIEQYRAAKAGATAQAELLGEGIFGDLGEALDPERLANQIENANNGLNNLANTINGTVLTGIDNMAGGLANALVTGKSLGEVLRQSFYQVATSIAQAIIKALILRTIMAAFGGGGGGFLGSIFGGSSSAVGSLDAAASSTNAIQGTTGGFFQNLGTGIANAAVGAFGAGGVPAGAGPGLGAKPVAAGTSGASGYGVANVGQVTGKEGVRIVNVTSDKLVADFMNSSAGERSVLNVVERNPGQIRQRIA